MRVPSWIAVIVMAVWVVSLIVRVMIPSAASVFISTDAVVLLVVGYYFSATAVRRRNGGSL
jgi:hypothetical protein